MKDTAIAKTEQENDLELLHRFCPRGSTIYCILRHTSVSGMMRVIDLYTYNRETMWRISAPAARLLGLKYDPTREGVVTDACGMDAGAYLVHSLGRALYGRNEHDEPDPMGSHSLRPEWL